MMKVTEFMDINGDEIWDTEDGWDWVSEGYLMEETTDDPLPNLDELECDTSQFMTAQLVQAQLKCRTFRCGGTTLGSDDFCYYCQKKHDGLITGKVEEI